MAFEDRIGNLTVIQGGGNINLDRFGGRYAPVQAGEKIMFTVEEPALALNDMRVRGHIHMSRSLRVRKDDSRENIVGCVAMLASQTPGGYLKSLVLNSHGAPGLSD